MQQGRKRMGATAPLAPFRSRWSLDFVKNLTIFDVSKAEVLEKENNMKREESPSSPGVTLPDFWPDACGGRCGDVSVSVETSSSIQQLPKNRKRRERANQAFRSPAFPKNPGFVVSIWTTTKTFL